MNSRNGGNIKQLSDGYVRVRALLDGRYNAGAFVNIIGMAVDMMVPVETRGPDWKSEMKLIDHSVEDQSEESLTFSIFRPQAQMPDVSAGDVVIVRSAKVQRRDYGPFSLLTNRQTLIFVFKANQIPKPPSSAHAALTWPKDPSATSPSLMELKHVSVFFHSLKKDRIPSEQEFETAKVQSTNVKQKFRLLEDVLADQFCDTIGEVVKVYDIGSRMTVWLTDYTENEGFWLRTDASTDFSEGGQDGDPYGYTAKSTNLTDPSTDWGGPKGKRNIQITVYEPHATAIREHNIGKGWWVSMRNLQIKWGTNGSNLEGFLREDQREPNQVRISPLDLRELFTDLESVDPRLKAAIQRKKDYMLENEKQDAAVKSAALAGQKRKANLAAQGEPANSKARRGKRRQQKQEQQKVAAEEAATEACNASIKCENQSQPLSQMTELLKQHHLDTVIDEETIQLPLPFINAQYRTKVRVVDFGPDLLEDFARQVKVSEFDILSNNGDEGDSDAASDVYANPNDSQTWEWQFSLQIEDASTHTDPQRIWVVVDNAAAQCLLDMDASDLRLDDDNLERLRNRLFILWGNLEEVKAAQSKVGARRSKGDQPPPDSSDVEAPGEQKVANRPFNCCVKQYGIKVRNTDEEESQMGSKWRYERVFGMYGARISSMGGNAETQGDL